jgi:hypothetical protein
VLLGIQTGGRRQAGIDAQYMCGVCRREERERGARWDDWDWGSGPRPQPEAHPGLAVCGLGCLWVFIWTPDIDIKSCVTPLTKKTKRQKQ